MPGMKFPLLSLLLVWLFACGNPLPPEMSETPAASPEGTVAPAPDPGEVVKPPFAVRDNLSGLLLAWFDDSGMHTASSRDQIPQECRAHVRVDSMQVPPDQRLDPEYVYVADVRSPGSDGSYKVVKMRRTAFDAIVDQAHAPPPAQQGQVVLYKASWCGACKAAEAYMKSRGVNFVAYDIEKDAQAASEMRAKVKAAGKVARGVPVIDFRGHILLGFDRSALAKLIDG